MSNMRVGGSQQRQTVRREPQRQTQTQTYGTPRRQQPPTTGTGRSQYGQAGTRQPSIETADFRPDFARLGRLVKEDPWREYPPGDPPGEREEDRTQAQTSGGQEKTPDGQTRTGPDKSERREQGVKTRGAGGQSSPFMQAGQTGQTKERADDTPSARPASQGDEAGEAGQSEKTEKSDRPEKTEGSEDSPRSGKGWLERIRNANLPKTGKQWINYVKEKMKGLLSSIRRGIAGPFTNQMDRNNGWASNVLFSGASNSQHTVGWMNPYGKTAMGYALSKALKDSPSLVDAMNKFSGRPYPGFPRNAIAKYWHADKVGGDGYFQSPLRFSKNTQGGPNPTKNVFVGVSGGPEGAFARSIQDIGKVMKEEFNTTNFIYHRGTARADQQIASAFGKIREYALANPDQPVSVAFMLDTHGGTSGGNRAEGSGHGFTGQVDERTLKGLVNRYLGGLDNVGVHMIVSACHSGAYLN